MRPDGFFKLSTDGVITDMEDMARFDTLVIHEQDTVEPGQVALTLDSLQRYHVERNPSQDAVIVGRVVQTHSNF